MSATEAIQDVYRRTNKRAAVTLGALMCAATAFIINLPDKPQYRRDTAATIDFGRYPCANPALDSTAHLTACVDTGMKVLLQYPEATNAYKASINQILDATTKFRSGDMRYEAYLTALNWNLNIAEQTRQETYAPKKQDTVFNTVAMVKTSMPSENWQVGVVLGDLGHLVERLRNGDKTARLDHLSARF